ncbi:MAG: circularly permuted type 2 ATP-grasp protein [Pseudomonadales bacterium]|nr:circularly permuted type 2 ATP-grasp protein [Pseudomonadales bacterium]
MSTPLPSGDGIDELLAGYRPLPGHYDELMGPDGQPRQVWQALLRDFAAMGRDLRDSAGNTAEGLLREHDVAYIAADGNSKRPWHLDVFPLLIEPEDWQGLADGLVQRARLLNAITADLYGPQQLLKSGAIPAPMVFANPEFMPNSCGYKVRDGEFLQFLAFDLGRAPDGTWWVLSQRTESPAGIGYALENRIVTSRSIPEQFNAYNLHRLAGFFRSFADHFAALGDQHRSVVLTGGPIQQDYFEHALIGRYLGYPVVESADLTVRDSRVFLKTLEGLERVDLIIRRIASEHSDPLELRAPPGMGIAGLLHAARTGNVLVANAIGSGIAESLALQSLMPALCEQLLGEPLRVPGVATWWCGDPAAREHVLANTGTLSLRHAFTARHLLSAGAAEFAASDQDLPDRAALEAALAMHPQDYVGIERINTSTVPCLSAEGTLRAVPMVIRVYVAATANGYQVMPGALVKVSGVDLGTGVPVSKDAWVLSREPIEPETLLKPLRAATLKRSDRDLPSKTADDLFWLGRYFERAEGNVRLFRSLFLHLSGEAAFGNVPVALNILTGLMVSLGQVSARHSRRVIAAGYRGVEHEIWNVLFDPESPDSLANVLANVARTADQVRERLSADAWRIIERLTAMPRLRWRGHTVNDAVAVLNDLTEAQSAVNGLIHENMTRGYGWRFLDLGRRLERARYIIRVMRELLIRVDPLDPGVLGMQLELADSLITYRSRYKTEPQLPAVLDLVLADDTNPRSLVFQLGEMKNHMAVMPLEELDGHLSRKQRILIGMHTEITLADVDKLAGVTSRNGRRTHLNRLLNRCEQGLDTLTDLISQTYFSHSTGHRVTGNVLKDTADHAV